MDGWLVMDLPELRNWTLALQSARPGQESSWNETPKQKTSGFGSPGNLWRWEREQKTGLTENMSKEQWKAHISLPSSHTQTHKQKSYTCTTRWTLLPQPDGRAWNWRIFSGEKCWPQNVRQWAGKRLCSDSKLLKESVTLNHPPVSLLWGAPGTRTVMFTVRRKGLEGFTPGKLECPGIKDPKAHWRDPATPGPLPKALEWTHDQELPICCLTPRS